MNGKIITNSSQLKKFMAFIFIVLSISLYFNKNPITGYAIVESQGFDSVISLDVSEMKYELITGETKKAVFYAKNNLDKQIEVEVGVAGKATNFVNIEQKKYTLQPKESVPIEIKLSSALEAIPQLYFGDLVVSTEGKSKVVSMQILVKKRIQDAIDLNLQLQKSIYIPGEEIPVQLTIKNTGNEKADLQLDLKLSKDSKDIFKTSDVLEVTTQNVKSYTVKIPTDAQNGQYNFNLKATVKMGKQYAILEKNTPVDIELPIIPEMPSQATNNFAWWIIASIIFAVLILTGQVLLQQEIIELPKIIKIFGKKSKVGEEEKHFIKERFCYLINEKGTRASYETLRMLHHEGYSTLCITRLNPKLLVEEVPEFKDAKIFWLTTQEGSDNLGPTDIEGIFNTIDKFTLEHEKSAILLDGLSFLSLNCGFNQIMLLLQYVKDKVSTRRGIFIVPINTSTLSKKEIEQMAEEITILDGDREIMLEIYKQIEKKQQDSKAIIQVSEQLLIYIRKELQSGYSAKQVSDTLLNHGWPKQVIDKAFEVITASIYGVRPINNSPNNFPNNLSNNFDNNPNSINYPSNTNQSYNSYSSSNAYNLEQVQLNQNVIQEINQKSEIATIDFQKLKEEFDQVTQMVNKQISLGKNTAKLDLEIALLSGDLEIAGITNDQKDIHKVKIKLDEIKKQLNKDSH